VAHSRSDPFDAKTYQGPQVSQTQYDRIMNYVECGKQEGAKVISGGKRHGNKGYFIEPVSTAVQLFMRVVRSDTLQTIFGDVTSNMTIVREEIFGPVIAMTAFDTEEEAIEAANDTNYGLASAIFTTDLARAHKVAGKIKAGTIWINCYNELHPQIPFGGFKESGIGRELGEYALENYMEIKAVHVNLGKKSALPVDL
jgi:aldehyde dehydrogenase (NAD+)